MSTNPAALQESRVQGSVSFPCSMYRADARIELPGRPLITKNHWHRSLEIIHCEKGLFQIGVNMEIYNVAEEAFFFVGSETLHSVRSERDYLEQAVLFDPQMLASLVGNAADSGLIYPLTRGEFSLPLYVSAAHPAFPAVRDAYMRIVRTFEDAHEIAVDQFRVSAPHAQLRIRSALMEILAELSETGSLQKADGGIEDSRSVALKEVMTYIERHKNGKIYIHDLADIMNMNEQYFCRFFKKTVGRTPITYVNEIRIRDAALRVASTNDPISTIAEDNGFVNMGNFIKQFRRIIGVGPAEYRKAMRSAG